jgi:hypothetical protein
MDQKNTPVEVRGFPGPKSGTRGTRPSVTYPHPYFGNKISVFKSLQVGMRCKIVKTKELFAKSSRIRSYAMIRPFPATFA